VGSEMCIRDRVKHLKLMKITQLLGPWKIFWTCIELYCCIFLVLSGLKISNWAKKNRDDDLMGNNTMVSQRWLYLSLEALVHPREKLGPRSASLLRYATGKRVFFLFTVLFTIKYRAFLYDVFSCISPLNRRFWRTPTPGSIRFSG
jgi:hypothetical protein